ncbi:MAG: TauD/TfdA family dioxygenase [Legionella sp.]|jgi:alpha-ketoglutarate-dependent taurine dioxygenase
MVSVRKTAPFFEDQNLLAVIESTKEASFQDLSAYLLEEREVIDELMLEYGAVLLRGFTVDDPKNFSQFTKEYFKKESLGSYLGGNSPRSAVLADVYTSTNTPPQDIIPQHLEMSYTNRMPETIIFWCQTPSEQFGQTPLTNFQKIYECLDDSIKAVFADGVIFINHFISNRNFLRLLSKNTQALKSWEESYATCDVDKAIAICDKLGQKVKVLPGKLSVSEHISATVVHPKKKTIAWRLTPIYIGKNYIDLKSYYMYSLVNSFYRLGFEITFPDGSKIPKKYLNKIDQEIRAQTRSFLWQKNDILIIDNYQVAHGRNYFIGDRKICVSFL